MFPGHVYRGKVYCWWGQILEDGTCIDGFDEFSPGDPGYAEKRDFIEAWKRAERVGWTRPKLFIEAWEQDEEWTRPSEVRAYLESL